MVRPVKQLAGFKRLTLAPGEEREITFQLHTAQLGFYNENMDFVVEPGAFDIMVGTSAHDIAFIQEIRLTGSTVDVMGRRVYTCPVSVR